MSACCKCGYDQSAAVIQRWEFDIPRAVQSGNAHVHNVGASRYAYKAARDAWARDMMTIAIRAGMPVATRLRRVTMTRLIGKGQRAFDRDNFATGCKPVVDAMCRAGMLLGDRPDQAEIHYAQVREHGRGFGLRVLIEELSP